MSFVLWQIIRVHACICIAESGDDGRLGDTLNFEMLLNVCDLILIMVDVVVFVYGCVVLRPDFVVDFTFYVLGYICFLMFDIFLCFEITKLFLNINFVYLSF